MRGDYTSNRVESPEVLRKIRNTRQIPAPCYGCLARYLIFVTKIMEAYPIDRIVGLINLLEIEITKLRALTPEAGGREIAISITKLQEAKMWLGEATAQMGNYGDI